MANVTVSGGTNITLLVNGDTLNTTLLSTTPLYQTFSKGTTDFRPNWETEAAKRPTIYPRVYSVMEGAVIPPSDVSWKYNGINIVFDENGVATAPAVIAGKVQEINHNNSKALKVIGNIASSSNNDSDTISFQGNVLNTLVSADATLLIEESQSTLYRLFMSIPDDVIDGSETSLLVTANLFNSGAQLTSDVEYEFVNFSTGAILRAKSSVNTFIITKEMISSQLMVSCKAYVGGTFVAQENRQIWDSTDPYTIICDRGSNYRQTAQTDVTYNFSLLNTRTGSTVPGIIFSIKVYKNSTAADISSQFTITNSTVTIPGAKINEHKSIYIDVSCVV